MGEMMDIEFEKYFSQKELKKIKIKKSIHYLIKGNSLKLLEKIPPNSINLVITDPPYNKGLDYGKYYDDSLSWDKFYENSKIWLKQVSKTLAKDGSLYIITYPEIASRYLIYLEDTCGLKLRRWLTWQYPSNFGHSTKNFTRTQRTILFMVKDSKAYTFNKNFIIQPYKNPEVSRIKKRIENGERGRGSYDVLTEEDLQEIIRIAPDVLRVNLLKNVSKERFTVSKLDKNVGHPCQLPPLLLKILISVSSKPNDMILDPFAGTFMTNKIAASLDRNSVGIEINPRYVKYGMKRLSK
jgi:DNA modification methylase